MSDDVRYSLTELADLAGVTPRTVRYYLSSGLLPGVGPSGPGSKYGEEHLRRLRLIRRLQRDHLPLAEIRRRLDELDDDAIRGLAEAEDAPPPPDTALDYVRSVLALDATGHGRTGVLRPLDEPASPRSSQARAAQPASPNRSASTPARRPTRSSAPSGNASSSLPTSSSTSGDR